MSGILRALGDSKTPLIFLIVASVFKCYIGLDFFVLSFGWGVVGAGVATAFFTAYFSFGMYYLCIQK